MEATVWFVDLETNRLWTESLDDPTYRRYPGGSALAVYLLLKHMPQGAAPLDRDNVLVFAVSPLTGLPISGQSRVAVSARSPLTGAVGDSQAGGFFPAQMRAAGADAIVFLGKAPEPVYFWLQNGQGELRPARHLWGKGTGEVQNLIRGELADDKVQIAQIGPAGENRVLYASIINNASRANGRTGMGAVMGSKNLKAVAVRGTEYPRPVLGDEFKALVKRSRTIFDQDRGMQYFGKYGTSGLVAAQNGRGGLPTRNWAAGYFAEAGEIEGEKLYDTCLKERDTCYGCFIRCKRVVEIPGEVDPVYGGPEYETIAAFGSYCGISDLKAVCRASALCNEYGLDTISAGATIAWAMECSEKGLLDDGGLNLKFGNGAAMLKTLAMIAKRQGIGELLAEGSKRAAEQLGEEARELTVTVKGNELPAHMPQIKRSLALIYAVNPFGADHESSEHDGALLSEVGTGERRHLQEMGIMDRLPTTDLSPAKVKFAFYTQIFYSLLDTLGLCQFVWGPSWQMHGPEDTVELVRCATGWNVSLWELMKAGERRLNLLRAFNAREGIGREEDVLPKKLFKPLGAGPSKDWKVEEGEFAEALELYYAMAGWNVSNGFPTKGKLEELDLGWVGEMLPT